MKATVEMDTTALDEALEKIASIEDGLGAIKNDTIFVSPADLAEMLGCTVSTAREIFNRKDFPVCDYGKTQKVFLPALWDYFRKPCRRNDENN